MDETPGTGSATPSPTAEEFHQDLTEIGFAFVQEGRRGIMQYSKRATGYLTISVHHDPGDASVLMSYEHSLGDYLDTLGLQVGSNEPLNQFLFPQRDSRGPADISFVVTEITRIEGVLKAVDLLAD